MSCLRIFVFTVVLGCGLSIPRPDFLISEREQKLQKLLKSLEAYSPDSHRLNAGKNTSKHDLHSIPKPTDDPRINGDPDRNSIPQHEEIRTYEDYYRIMYGTEEGVSLLRKHYGPTGLQRARANFRWINRGMDDVKQANAHYLKIRKEARCRIPVPRVVRVQDFHPDPATDYMPRCTVLHRCSDDGGCCDGDAFHCVASEVQEVQLNFYTLSAGRFRGQDTIVKLLFENHTQCQCQPINDMPRMIDGRSHPLDGADHPPTTSKCRECPVPFTSRTYRDGRCGCDCFDRQKPCLRIKRGRDPLSNIERRCVESSHCHIPECEYGQYNIESGYCPRRHDEEQRPHPRRPALPSPNHRWAFHERD